MLNIHIVNNFDFLWINRIFTRVPTGNRWHASHRLIWELIHRDEFKQQCCLGNHNIQETHQGLEAACDHDCARMKEELRDYWICRENQVEKNLREDQRLLLEDTESTSQWGIHRNEHPGSSLLLPSDLLRDLPSWRPLWRPRKCEPSQSASWSREQGRKRWKVDLEGQRESISSELLIWDFLPRKDYPGSKTLSITSSRKGEIFLG